MNCIENNVSMNKIEGEKNKYAGKNISNIKEILAFGILNKIIIIIFIFNKLSTLLSSIL